MRLVQKRCRWASNSFSKLRSPGTSSFSILFRRGFCIVAQRGQLTLASLGLNDAAEEGLEGTETSIRDGEKRRPERRILEQPQQISTARVSEPSREEMKQAALEASSILAGVARMRLPRPKKPSGEQAGLKQVTLEEEQVVVTVHADHLSPMLETMKLTDQKTSLSHPWPEWLDFLENIKSKNCFDGSEQAVEEGKHLFESYAAVRHAICAFGRTHSDMFRSLGRKDLRVLANYGCPDLEKKASNASKRLRAHFRIPEGEVCQRCSLKMTCPRAFLAPPIKLPMNTLDVVRILAGYATNVWPNSDCCTLYPKELETSVRNLLREIPTFNGRLWDSEEVQRPSLESVQTKKAVNYSQPVDQKPGDWTCPNCEFLNFNRNRRCRECKVFRPPQAEQQILPGDWECPKCRYLNFSKNMYCRECNTDRLSRVNWTGGERLPDDHPSDRLYEPKYEASEDEESWEIALTNSTAETEIECNANFTDEEDMGLLQGSSNAVSRKISKVTFRWNEDKEEREDLCVNSRERSKIL